jgi:Mrp family chromosome partitioning ATPase
MPSEEEIQEALKEILVPNIARSLTGLNLIREIKVNSDRMKVTLASTGLNTDTQKYVQDKASEALEGLPGIKGIAIEFEEAKPQDLNKIDHVIAVMSGKGGVGKSLVTGLLAIGLNRQGYEVGVLDADITGPSIPKMFGITARPGGSETGILPVLSKSGIEIMSVNLLLPHEDDAVIWRGPLIGKMIQQFWDDVVWGKLDYLLVDLPPGTADAPLTVLQTLPLSGVVIVFTPQDLTAMVVKKAMNMAQQMNIPILGVVENMSYLVSPDTAKRIEIFGSSNGDEMALAAGAPLLEQLPLDPELARLCDEGAIERYNSEGVGNLTQALLQAIPVKTG